MYNLELAPAALIKKWKREGEEEDIKDGGNEDEVFFKQSKAEDMAKTEDRSIPVFDYAELAKKWEDNDNIAALRSRFTITHMNGNGEGDEGDDQF